MTPQVRDKVLKHVEHSRQYFENGREAFDKQEISKAGELFWGSVTQAFHALAAYRDRTIESHRDLKNFVIQISQEVSDDSLFPTFQIAEILHKGFYDMDVDLYDLESNLPNVEHAIEVVLDLIPGDST